ncbi:EKC/KEOPS complex subunit LAGE3-like [Sceloporus undulatus]|uniref:EKC/KEOPS complex subunit LAGE3-like n=1 Tax=Sceloporus undulatus TaxID=8520 RepID=UPI001C4B5DC1|nr:EKC/KEOPS complex subunit LAGE3-like [Sceloporus undulatus]
MGKGLNEVIQSDEWEGLWRRKINEPAWAWLLWSPAPFRTRDPSFASEARVAARAAPGSSLVFELSIPFPSSLLARIALGSLAPDPEPRKGGISKELSVMEDTLHVRWKADEARILRVSVSSFLEHLSLVVETMDLFGPPVV